MANLDLSPLYRTTIGFDRLPLLLQSAMRVSDSDLGYPPTTSKSAATTTIELSSR